MLVCWPRPPPDNSTTHLLSVLGEIGSQYENTLEGLERINASIVSLLSLITGMDAAVNSQLGWLMDQLGGLPSPLTHSLSCPILWLFSEEPSVCVFFKSKTENVLLADCDNPCVPLARENRQHTTQTNHHTAHSTPFLPKMIHSQKITCFSPSPMPLPLAPPPPPGGAQRGLHVLTTLAGHACFLLLATLCVLFVRAPALARVALLVMVVGNAAAELRTGSSLSLHTLAALEVVVLAGERAGGACPG